MTNCMSTVRSKTHTDNLTCLGNLTRVMIRHLPRISLKLQSTEKHVALGARIQFIIDSARNVLYIRISQFLLYSVHHDPSDLGS